MDGKVTGIEVRRVESGGDDNYIRGSIIITENRHCFNSSSGCGNIDPGSDESKCCRLWVLYFNWWSN